MTRPRSPREAVLGDLDERAARALDHFAEVVAPGQIERRAPAVEEIESGAARGELARQQVERRRAHSAGDERHPGAGGRGREGAAERAEQGARLARARLRQRARAAPDHLAEQLDPDARGPAANIVYGEGATQVGLEPGAGLDHHELPRGRRGVVGGDLEQDRKVGQGERDDREDPGLRVSRDHSSHEL